MGLKGYTGYRYITSYRSLAGYRGYFIIMNRQTHGTYTNRGHYQFIEVIRGTENFHAIGPISTLQRGDTKVIKTPHIIEYVIMDISAIEITHQDFMQIIKKFSL